MNNIRVIWLLCCTLLINGCSLQLVAHYDKGTMETITQIDQRIELIFQEMLMVEKANRQFERYALRYLRVQVSLSSFKRRQHYRPHNDETAKQATILLNFWQQDMSRHQQDNTMSDFIIKQRIKQYRRLIDALISGEMAKPTNQEML